MEDLNPLEWALLPLKKYATFTGRAPRAEYWWYNLASTICSMVISGIDNATGDSGIFGSAYSLALLVPSIAVAVRRLHDTDRSGWWLLLMGGTIALVGAAIGFGSTAAVSGMSALVLIALVPFFAAAVALLVFMVLPGTQGSNRFGPDPYGPSDLEEVFA